MKKAIIWLSAILVIAVMAFSGVSCKATTTDTTTAVATTAAAGETKATVAAETTVAETTVAETTVAAKKQLEFVLISNGNPGDQFWQSLIAGMNDAGKTFGVKVTMQFSSNDLQKQVDMVDAAVVSKVDGIGIVISDKDAFDAPVQKALDAGIAVVTFNVDDPEGSKGNPRLAFVGQDLFAAGVNVGETIAKLTPQKKHVGCFVEMPAASYAVQRYGGVKQALDAAGIKSTLVDAGYDTPANVISKMEAFLQGNPDVDHVATIGSFTADYVVDALKEMNLVGKVTNGGFDISEKVAGEIKDDFTLFACDQQGYSQSFYAVAFLYNYIVNNQIPSDYNTGMAIIDKSNVDKFKAAY